MIAIVLSFLIGDILAQKIAGTCSFWLLIMLLITTFIFSYKYSQWRYLSCLLFSLFLGLAYASWHIEKITRWTLPHELENTPVQINGEIISLPVKAHAQMQFDFYLEQLQYGNKLIYPHSKIKLSWRDVPEHLQVGDEWRLIAKLKQIHGLHNPGGFNYEAWALEHGLRASGVVINNEQNKKLKHHLLGNLIEQFRQFLFEKLTSLPSSTTRHWLIALVVGVRANIPDEQWQVLRYTGTNHLMAIGGLHIGMVAGFIHLVVSKLWRRLSRCLLLLPAQEAGACAALLSGVLYAALSGFALPAQRACLMLTIYVAAVLSRRKINAWYVWSMAMLVVLLINPLSVLSESFWLSFGTIALIIFGMSGRLTITKWWKWGRVQWVIALGLLPLSLLLFQECSLASFLANTIAIPWLGLLILPFCLSGTLFLFLIPPLGKGLLFFADKSLETLWFILTWISQWHGAVWSHAMPNSLIFILTMGGVLMWIIPAKFPARWLGVIWLLPLILYQAPLLPVGRAQFTLLDVGQGLSAVIQTRHHVLVFDAGPRSVNVVVPFLRSQFVKQVDMLVISHGDEDHIGGAKEILQNLSVKAILTSVPEKFTKTTAQLCLAGQHWQWDGVNFEFLYPYMDTLHLGNDSSCVLRIDAGSDSVLIPGDIEKFSEIKLLERAANHLNVTALVAPHHGSHTSGLPAFVNAVYPRYILYAVGYANRYHFPHEDIVNAYHQLFSEAFLTSDNGAIQWLMGVENTSSPVGLLAANDMQSN